jgi:hypothetical protein
MQTYTESIKPMLTEDEFLVPGPGCILGTPWNKAGLACLARKARRITQKSCIWMYLEMYLE